MSERGDTILIEADTIESALEALTERYGSEATIVSAERVRKGGIGGFFATEVVELVAIPPFSGRHTTEDDDHTNVVPADAPKAGRTGGVDSAFAQLLDAAEHADTPPTRRQSNVAVLEPEPEQIPGPAPKHPAVRTPVEGIRWDVPRLIEMGLPGSLIEALMPLDPVDDLAHVERLARSITSLTGRPPAEPHRMIGSRDGRHTREIEVTDRSRPIHLVLGSGDQLDVTKPPPAVVSWVGDSAAPTALAVAWQTGATLGWATSNDGRISRVTPVDAALAIRRLLDAG